METAKPHHTATAHRRQKQIEDCLFENLLHTPYTSISVADLCRQVGISRKAFYNYYHDKDACFCAIVYRVIQEAMLCASTTVSDDADALESATAFLDFWKGRRSFWDILLRDRLLHFLLTAYIDYVLKEERTFLDILSTPDVTSDTDILACYINMQVTLLLQWYLRGFDTPAEEMARKFLRLMHAPMIPPEME